MSVEDKAARDTITTAVIRQWKIIPALFQQKGGRVSFQQGVPEPLDAWRKFLEAAQARAEFATVDMALEKPFWQSFRNDARHSFMPSVSDAFAPWVRP